MLLLRSLVLRKDIEEYRSQMYNLANLYSLNEPIVINISKELDDKIVELQKIIKTCHSVEA
jgi:hypothetical protein